MLRTDRERSDADFFNYVFSKCEEIFVAFIDEDAFPYCLPFNFCQKQNSIYIHSALKGHKLELIKLNPNVAFTLACDIRVDVKKSTTRYKSVCGRGTAHIVEMEEEKRLALDLIGLRYNAYCKRPATPEMISRVNIIRIDILTMTGKSSAPETLPQEKN